MFNDKNGDEQFLAIPLLTIARYSFGMYTALQRGVNLVQRVRTRHTFISRRGPLGGFLSSSLILPMHLLRWFATYTATERTERVVLWKLNLLMGFRFLEGVR